MASTPQSVRQRITVGRILHAYSNKWTGPRPAVVVQAFGEGVEHANVNVLFDGANDGDALAAVRASPAGNTFPSVTVHEAMTDAQRAVAMDSTPECDWYQRRTMKVLCEWPARG